MTIRLLFGVEHVYECLGVRFVPEALSLRCEIERVVIRVAVLLSLSILLHVPLSKSIDG